MITTHTTVSAAAEDCPAAAPVMRIGIMGTPTSSGNRGVLALGAALVRLCQEHNPGAETILFGSQRDERPAVMRPFGRAVPIRIVPWRLSPKARLKDNLFVIFGASLVYRTLPPARRFLRHRIPWIGEVAQASFVGDVRGGDSFSDIYGLERFLVATLPVLSIILIKGSIVQFPQTYGPYKSRVARAVARYVLRHSSVVIARDKDSQRVAQDLVGSAQTVRLSPDVAFALYSDPNPPLRFTPPLANGIPPRTIGVNVNGLMYGGGYTGRNMFGLKFDYPAFLAELLTALLSRQEGAIILVPHTIAPHGDVESDNEASEKVRAALPPELQHRVHVLEGELDAHQLKGVIRQCDFFIGSRMHSCIAALSQGVPCVGVAYSMKFKGVFESVDMGDFVVDARAVDASEATRRILDLYHSRDAKRPILAAAVRSAQQRLAQVFTELGANHR